MNILVITPYDKESLIVKTREILTGLKIDLMNTAYFTPSIFITDPGDLESSFLKVRSVAYSIKEKPELLPLPNEQKNKIYAGMAPKNIDFDVVITYNKEAVEIQEDYIKFIFGPNALDGYYTAEDSEKSFKETSEVSDFINSLLEKNA